tara:strand:+ start:42 stop:260 length:219 start_codon:yes stop_codon:yes gene_type:complete
MDNRLYGKPPSPINKKIDNKTIITLDEENLQLKKEIEKLKKENNIILNKIKIFESEVCCGCCGLRWAVTMNK